MTEGSLITDVRELSSRASVIDLKGDVTASAEKALADAYTRASGKFTRTIVRVRRALRSWIWVANSSLPVPVSQKSSTVESVEATCSTWSSTR